jgi:hypothetical protein
MESLDRLETRDENANPELRFVRADRKAGGKVNDE